MKPFKLDKKVKPGGYHQFWQDQKPPVLIVTKFPRPKLPLHLFAKVNKPSEYIASGQLIL